MKLLRKKQSEAFEFKETPFGIMFELNSRNGGAVEKD